MPKPLITKTAAEPLNPNVLAFKPRQLLLLHSKTNPTTTTTTTTMKKEDNNSNDHKATLVRSVARFLERSGFSKTLNKFRSEAGFQEDTLGDLSFDLEEVFLKFLELRDQESKDLSKEPVSTDTEQKEKKKNKKNVDPLTKEEKFGAEELEHPANNISSKSPKQKDKKKSKSEPESLGDVSNQPPSETAAKADKENSEAVAISDGKKSQDSENENKSKDKKKKVKKKPSGSAVTDKVEQPVSKSEQLAEGQKFEEAECLKDPKGINSGLVNVVGNHLENKDVKPEKKKKKSKKQAVSENVCDGNSEKLETEKANGTETNGLKVFDEQAKDKQNKGSKKRKFEDSEGGAAQPADEKPTEGPKRRKTGTSEEAELGEQSKNQKGSMNPLDAQANGNVKKNENGSSVNSNKKLDRGSVEPKSGKRFQRVNVEEVVFSDERLQDNSYWSKGGAENGYGAKAQEILSQVKGRGFRHEKTKKKRGTYRGGQIDVQSHSIKFNYSDEE